LNIGKGKEEEKIREEEDCKGWEEKSINRRREEYSIRYSIICII
jgi:hypothetical protein